MAVDTVTLSGAGRSMTLTGEQFEAAAKGARTITADVSDEEFRQKHDAQVRVIREARAAWEVLKAQTKEAKEQYDLEVSILEQLDDDRRMGKQQLPFAER